MQRDVIFLVGGINEDLLVSDAAYRLLPIADDFRLSLQTLGKRIPELQLLLVKCPKPIVAVFRNDLESLDDSFSNAFQALAAICDAYTLFAIDGLPDISSLVEIREGSDAHATMYSFTTDRGKLRFHSSDGGAEQRWAERERKLLQRFLPLFDALTNSDPALSSTEIGEQLALSLRMFRHGCQASTVGIEFLCKFSALEGLVCGAEQSNKHKLLKERLGELFRSRPNVADLITSLWKLRCEASHQSKAFSGRFVQATADVDFLFTGAVTFAAEKIKTSPTLSDLWVSANTYDLPPEVLMEPETLRGRITKSWRVTGLVRTGIGPALDAVFKSEAAS